MIQITKNPLKQIGLILSLTCSFFLIFSCTSKPAHKGAESAQLNPNDPANNNPQALPTCPNVHGLDPQWNFSYSQIDFDQVLNDPAVNTLPDRLMDFLSTNANIALLYQQDPRVSQFSTIRAHTQAVLRQYLSQYPFFSLEYPISERNTDYKKLMLVLLALHDIGKACGASNHDQHTYTTPIVQISLRALRFSSQDTSIATALVDHDAIGEYLQQHGTLQAHLNRVRDQAATAGLTVPSFYKLQLSFYISDSSSYPPLMNQLYQTGLDQRILFRENPAQPCLGTHGNISISQCMHAFETQLLSTTLQLASGNITELTLARTADLSSVVRFSSALRGEFLPHQILFVLDIDGTLTYYSEPTRYSGNLGAIPERPGAIQMVQSLHAQGVQLLFSSAWNNFGQTRQKLIHLGLGGIAGINMNAILPAIQRFENIDFQVFLQGRVASVAIPAEDGAYYIRKAIAPRFVLTPPELASIRVVILVDDNPSYIRRFREDLIRFRPFAPSLQQVVFFPLTEVNG